MRYAAICLLLGLASRPAADEIFVPGDFPTLCLALENAQAGDIVIVQTSSLQDGGCRPDSQLTANVPVTIVGDPVCKIAIPSGGFLGGLRLDGPGSGAVVLVRVDLRYPFSDSSPSPGIFGGGFDELLMFESSVDQTLIYSGIAFSTGAGIETDVPFVQLADSQVAGSPGGSDGYFGQVIENGAPGISAPASTVVLIDSSVQGGPGSPFFEEGCAGCSCPASLANWGGKGADGVIASELFLVNSTSTGGVGANIVAYAGGFGPYNPAGPPTFCGQQPSGAAYTVSGQVGSVDDQRLAVRSPFLFPGPLQLEWSPLPTTSARLLGGASIHGQLFVSFGIVSPLLTKQGLLFLDSASLMNLGGFTSDGTATPISLPLPPDPTLVGQVVYFQMSSQGSLTRPAGGIIGE